MSELSSSTKAALDAARGALLPSVHDTERVLRALGANGSVPQSHGAPNVGKLAALPAGSKVTIVALLAIGAAVGYLVAKGPPTTGVPKVPAGHATNENVALPASAAPEVPSAAPADPPVALAAIRPKAVASGRRTQVPAVGGSQAGPPPSNAPTPSALSDSLAEEVELIQRAQQALRDDDARAALQLTEQHASRFPHGVLSAERVVLRVQALCSTGRVSEARGEADAFLAVSATSPQAARIRASCGGAP
jgi:hypothetical protein